MGPYPYNRRFPYGYEDLGYGLGGPVQSATHHIEVTQLSCLESSFFTCICLPL
jgi:hypothetical protein